MNANEPWPRSQIFCLISAYRSRMCLWNKTNNAYTDRDKRNTAWEEVARASGVDVRTAERKMKSLKTQFFHYYKLTLKDQDEPYVPKWFAYQALQFLVENRLPRETIENHVQPHELEQIKQETYEIDDDDDYDEPPPLSNVEAQIDCSPVPPPPQLFPTPTVVRLKKPPRYGESPSTHFDPIDYTSVESLQPPAPTVIRDEFAIFSEYIADRLRRLPDAKSRLIAKHNIHNALFEVELKAVESQISDRSQISRLQKSNVSIPSSSAASPSFSQLEPE